MQNHRLGELQRWAMQQAVNQLPPQAAGEDEDDDKADVVSSRSQPQSDVERHEDDEGSKTGRDGRKELMRLD